MRHLLILVAMVLLISGTCMSAPQPPGGAGAITIGMLAAPQPKVLGDVRKNPGTPLSGAIMKRG